VSSERFNQLVTKHSKLRLRSAVQRRELGSTMNDIEHRLSGLDRALVGPKRLIGWASRGALIYTTARRFINLRRPE
jgi:hypothetical protein